ncbi:MAG: 3-hydroxybutyryl-CoA dehydrogenase [Burkholderiaceae bacterium]
MANSQTLVAAGAGRMGRSMAVAFAYAGLPMTVLDLKDRDAAGFDALRASAQAEINGHLNTLHRLGVLVDEGAVAMLAGRISIRPIADAQSVLAEADVVFEGVPEVLENKRSAFEVVERFAPETCTIASTTSSFLSSDLAGMLSMPARFLNAHWLNPAYLIPLVEVSPHAGTDAGVTEQMNALLRQIGKEPVVCKASPGYIVPRLQALVMNEAVRMVEEGVASAEDIDKAARLGFGLRYGSMGVLEFVDFGGLDILYYASRYLAGAIDENRYASPPMVEKMMADGDVGVRSGQGLYDWRGKDVDAFRDETLGRFVESLRQQNLIKPPVL